LLLPDNEWLWDVFSILSSQMNVAGMGSFVGFNYSALYFILKAKDVPESMYEYVLDKLTLLTPIASKYWNKKDD
jgi:hypothetical protein